MFTHPPTLRSDIIHRSSIFTILLTGKPHDRYQSKPFYEEHRYDPTIFVGAAHCNFICKDFTQRPNRVQPVTLQICCCIFLMIMMIVMMILIMIMIT